MFGWCKPRKEFVSRLIDGESYQFKESDICEYDDLGDLYSVDADCYHVNFTKETFYEKFRVIHREAEYFEDDCVIDIYTYKMINSADEWLYLVRSLYLEKYYDWLNELYDFKKDLAFQELIDFEDVKRDINSTVSKKLYRDFRKYHNEAIHYSKPLEKKNSFIEMYESMMEAFRFASKNGKVKLI